MWSTLEDRQERWENFEQILSLLENVYGDFLSEAVLRKWYQQEKETLPQYTNGERRDGRHILYQHRVGGPESVPVGDAKSMTPLDAKVDTEVKGRPKNASNIESNHRLQ